MFTFPWTLNRLDYNLDIEMVHFSTYVVPQVLLSALNKRALQKQISDSNCTPWITEFNTKNTRYGREVGMIVLQNGTWLHGSNPAVWWMHAASMWANTTFRVKGGLFWQFKVAFEPEFKVEKWSFLYSNPYHVHLSKPTGSHNSVYYNMSRFTNN